MRAGWIFVVVTVMAVLAFASYVDARPCYGSLSVISCGCRGTLYNGSTMNSNIVSVRMAYTSNTSEIINQSCTASRETLCQEDFLTPVIPPQPGTYAFTNNTGTPDFCFVPENASQGVSDCSAVTCIVESTNGTWYATNSSAGPASDAVDIILNLYLQQVTSQNVTIVANTSSVTEYANQSTSAIFTVTNTGTDTDNFTLTNSTNSSFVSLQLNQTTITNLGSGSAFNVTLTFNSTQVGLFAINVTATSDTNASATDTASITFNVTEPPATPTFTVGPADDSSAADPTNITDNVNFTANATDANLDNWWLMICNTSSLSGTSCASTMLCNSTTVTSDTQASCVHDTTGELQQTQIWTAFACDTTGCTTPGSSGNSPYSVNHAPNVTAAPTVTSPAYANTLINCTSGTLTDPDSGDTPTVPTSSYLWYVNGSLELGQTSFTLDCGAVANCTRGADISCSHGIIDNHGLSGTQSSTSSNITVQNIAPTLTSITLTPSIGPNGTTVNVSSTGASDSDSDPYFLSCGDSSGGARNLCNSSLSGGSGEVWCVFNTTWTDDAAHIVDCVINDTADVSTNRSAFFTADNTPPSLTLISLEGDTSAPYWDIDNDSNTSLIYNASETGVSCRMNTSDLSYSNMGTSSLSCQVSGDVITCDSWPILGQQNVSAIMYTSCIDQYGNENNATNNAALTFGIDYTAPWITSNHTAGVKQPGYKVQITENDQPSGTTVTTVYCTTQSGSCAPSTPIDSGDNVTFSSRGTWNLIMSTQDGAGNVNSTFNETIVINSLASVTSMVFEDLINHTFRIYTNVSDADNVSGVQDITCNLYHQLNGGGSYTTKSFEFYSGSSALWNLRTNISNTTEGYDVGSTIRVYANCTDGVEWVNNSQQLNNIPNNAPVLDALNDYTVVENSTLIIDVNATDTDTMDVLVYGTNATTPFVNVTFNSVTGIFNLTPDIGERGNYSVVFNVTDSVGGTDSTTIFINVTKLNAQMSFSVIPDDGSTLASPTNITDDVVFTATAGDIDGDQWQLLVCTSNQTTGTLCTATNVCTSGFVSNGTQATCNHDTTGEQSETYDWWAFACDSTQCSLPNNTTSPYNVNHPPSVDPAPSISVSTYYADSALSCLTGTPADPDTADDPFTFNRRWLINGSVEPGETAFVLNCDLVANCTETASVQCQQNTTDEHGLTGPWNTSNTIVIANSAPSIDGYSPLSLTPSVDEGSSLAFEHNSSDVDGDPLTYQWLLNGSLQSTSQNWTYSPGFTASGVYNVTLIVSDSTTQSNVQWVVTVNNVNQVPSVVGIVDDNSSSADPTNEGSNVVFNGNATDPDLDTYFLLICNSSSLNSTGDGCAGTELCSSGLTASGVLASCNHDTTGESAESYSWFAWACDGTNCSSGTTNSPYAVNHAPTVPAPTIAGTNTTTGTLLCVNATPTDTDTGDNPTLNSYRWWMNGTIVGGQTSASFDCNIVAGCSKNTDVSCAHNAIDTHAFIGSYSTSSANVTILNTVPTAPTVDLLPNAPSVNDDLNCTITAASTDMDSDTITYTYEWLNDSSPVTILTGNTTVESGNTSSGENWTCVVTPNDGDGDGPSGSNSVTVENLPPSITIDFAPVAPSTVDNITCWGITTDAEGDVISAAYNLTGDVTGTGATTCVYQGTPGEYNCSVLIDSTSTNDGDNFTCALTPYDGTNYGTENSTSIVVDTVSAPISLTAILNTTDNTSVILNWTASPDALSYNIYYDIDVDVMLNMDPYTEPPDVTGVTTTNWNDATAGGSAQKYYRVAAVKGGAKTLASETVGKYDISISTGRNLIGFPLIQQDLSINSVTWALDDTSVYDKIVRYDSGLGFRPTDYYGTVWQWWGTFSDFENDRGYLFYPTSTAYTITNVGGVATTNRTLSIAAGRNLMSFSSPHTQIINDTVIPPGAAMPAFGSEERIARYDANFGWRATFYYGSTWKWWGNFDTIEPGRGYLFYPVATAYSLEYTP